jgi:hypothetical protein
LNKTSYINPTFKLSPTQIGNCYLNSLICNIVYNLMPKIIHWTFRILLLLLVLSSCRRDSNTNWNTDILAPLATTTLTINNLVRDSVLRTNPDSSVSIVFSNNVYSLNLADQFIHIPDTSIGQKFTVDSLGLPNILVNYQVSLGTMAKNLINTGQGFLGNFIINNNGIHDSFPAISNLPITPFVFNVGSYFQSATLSQDSLLFSVTNGLPIAIQNISYTLYDSGYPTPLHSGTIAYIPPFGTVFFGFSLPGVTIHSALIFKITNFSTVSTGSSTVLIDTSNYILIRGYISDIKVDSAIAIFQAQDIISQDQELTQNISNGRLFTYVDCNNGQLNVHITSAFPQPLRLTYKLLGAYDKFGRPLTDISTIPAAQNGQLGSINKIYDLSGYSINLTGTNGTLFNTYTQIIVAHMDSTGQLSNIGPKDSLHIQYFLQNIKPNYIKGYVGRDTISYTGTSPFSIANLFNSSAPNALQFNKANISVSIENGIGVDGTVLINSLSSVNANGTTVPLIDNSSNPVIGRPLYVGRATDFPLTPSMSTYNINSNTSNVLSFINNLPSQIKYNVLIKTNPSGNTGTYNQFAYLNSSLNVKLNVNIPLSLIANNLILKDSFNFSLGYSQKDVANILNGTLHVIVNNKFPLQANITLMAYDSAWNLLDTLLTNAQVNPAPLNSSCRATQSTQTILNVAASAQVINRVRTAKHAVMTVVFNTKSSNATCNGQFLNIYSDYDIAATITGDFIYKVKL